MNRPQSKQSKESLSIDKVSLQNVNLNNHHYDDDTSSNFYKNPIEEQFQQAEDEKENHHAIPYIPKEKSESDFHGVSQKEKKLLLMQSTNLYDEKTGRTGIMNRQNQVIQVQPQFIKVKASTKNRKESIHNYIENNAKENQNNKISRVQMPLQQRMISYLKNGEKQYFAVNIKEGFMNDTISVKLDGLSDTPLSSVFESKVFGKKINIFCGEQLIGRMESNFSGSVFHMYKVNFDKVEALPLGKIVYSSSLTFHQSPRKVQIYLKNPSLIDSPIEEESQTETKIQMAQPILSKKKNAYVVVFGTSQKMLPSIHNVMFMWEKEAVMKFFKIADTQYHLQMMTPMSPLIAYCYLLSSFSFKWTCQ